MLNVIFQTQSQVYLEFLSLSYESEKEGEARFLNNHPLNLTTGPLNKHGFSFPFTGREVKETEKTSAVKACSS